MIFIFLSSGLFLGWSLGANDAANIFGTAVSTKMIRFKVAAYTAGIFVILGAVIGGAGATHTLGKLGSVNALAGAFMVAFSAGFTVFLMTRYKIPVSTSQAIVGSIIGWNFYASMLTDTNSLTKIVTTWVLCPLLAAAIAMVLYIFTRWIRTKVKINLFAEDYRTRIGLIVIGAFGAYSLGANNIANVMGVFVSAQPFDPLNIFGLFTLSGAQILFLFGGISIAVGIVTYSYKVMDTVGASIIRLSPVTAFIVVLAESIVLFIFSSEGLESWLLSHGLPAIPLVPVSSSQAVVGAVIGIGLVKNLRQIRFRVLGEIAMGWVTTPVIAGLLTFVFLFFLQNVFNQKVYVESEFLITRDVLTHLKMNDVSIQNAEDITDHSYYDEKEFYNALKERIKGEKDIILMSLEAARVNPVRVNPEIVDSRLDAEWLSSDQTEAIKNLKGQSYSYHWQLAEDLQIQNTAWQFKPKLIENRTYNRNLELQYQYLYRLFKINH